ncbi:hypothetical protein Gohar_000665 [Gossypium harknessii]|uniref:Uncharacterized protein n=1 Tax=Gossypium harknessii TaxID=34285 RepID=A0A7J9I1D6_9ROSI|nr:hypothetical protein [Gossypium harknessii]
MVRATKEDHAINLTQLDHSLVRVQELEAKKGWHIRILSAHKNPL